MTAFLVICQIILIKNIKLMLNIIKRIFLRIKILKRFSFFYISNVYLDKKNNKVYTMAIQNKKE
ncbi:hypothetical protein [Fusobacterium animalis]|uniref:hypothetical protein n=1 Tax=Fusobacterium animalis TaxID=76859 RepID=UPI00039C9EC2|nr:hypothetical protein [Fusobacterium animalis]